MTSLPELGPRGEGWVLLQLPLLGAVLLSGVLAGGAWGGEVRLLTSIAGGFLLALGAFLVVRGFLDLGTNLTPMPRPRADTELVDTGIYGLVRHPLYGGLMLGSIGYGLLTASWLALLAGAAVCCFFVLRSRREETWLAERFDGYAHYGARTRRFIPWLF